MRHRIVSGTGFGNPAPVLLDNIGKENLHPGFAIAATKQYFSRWDGFDFKIQKTKITIGFEPGYQYEPLKIISINKDKRKSYICTGKAFGGYGSQIVKTTKYYSEYKYNCKFTKFVNKWHKELFK